jgi:hypothetical protein
MKSKFDSNEINNIEGKSAYHINIWRRQLAVIPADILVIQEDNSVSSTHKNMITGGIHRVLNVALMRFKFECDLENTCVFLVQKSNKFTMVSRIFLQQKKGVFGQLKWRVYRSTFGRAGDLPLEIIGIKAAEADELNLLHQLKSKPTQFPLENEVTFD